jgi:predicted permease
MAIGASRRRVVRQLVVEAGVMAAVAGAGAVAAAAVVPSLVMRALGDEIPPGIAGRFAPDATVLLFTAIVTVLAALVFALAPALHATRQTIALSSMDRGGTGGGRLPLRTALLAVQIAACTVLLAGAGLLTRAVSHAMTLDPGFPVDRLMAVSAYLPSDAPVAERRAYSMRLLKELEANRDVPVALTPYGPFNHAKLGMSLVLPGEQPAQARFVLRRDVSSRYFDVLGLPVLRGRMFPSDATSEAVVNEAFVRTYFPAGDAIGRTLGEVSARGAVSRTFTVVGVARDAYLTSFDRVDPVVFRPATSGALLIRNDAATVARIRATALALNGDARFLTRPVRDDMAKALEEPMMGAAVAWVLGLLALVLASVGVFGVFAYAVEERKREIGIRLALGAARRHIVRMVVSTMGRALLYGLVVGIVLSVAGSPLLRSYLFGLSPVDPLAYGAMLVLLTLAACVATLVPAVRACRVDPAITLRED